MAAGEATMRHADADLASFHECYLECWYSYYGEAKYDGRRVDELN